MQGAYGGLIIIVMYAGNSTTPPTGTFLITQNNIDILTEASQQILVQS